MTKDISWFRYNIAPKLGAYELEYKSFKNGDLGSLNQVEFNNEKRGGNIDFWDSGWIGIYLVDYNEGIELMNVLIEK